MARRQTRSRVVRRERRRRERERLRQRQMVRDMNAFLESESDIESFQDFEDALENPFDVETPQRAFETLEDTVQDMQETFNDTEEKRKRRYKDAEEKRKKTYREKHGVNEQNYNRITDMFGTDVWQRLHEIYQYDSTQFMDLIISLPENVTSVEIEYAMEQLWTDLVATGGGSRVLDEDAIIEAMELGFSYEEAIFLTQNEREYVPTSQQNIGTAVEDYVRSHIVIQEMERRARENIRNRYAESVRGRI